MIKDQKNIDEMICLAEMGRSSFGIFHDVINPISSLILFLDLLTKKDLEKHDIKQELKPILRSSKHMFNFIKTIQSDFYNHGLEKEFFRVDSVILNCIKILNYRAREKNISILFIRRGVYQMFSHKIKIYRLVINFISNSIDSFDEITDGRKRKIIIKLHEINENLIIEFSDNGSGISENIKKEIFRPLFTTKKHGSGLGLYNTKKIIETDLSGTIKLTTKKLVGTTFIVKIPK